MCNFISFFHFLLPHVRMHAHELEKHFRWNEGFAHGQTKVTKKKRCSSLFPCTLVREQRRQESRVQPQPPPPASLPNVPQPSSFFYSQGPLPSPAACAGFNRVRLPEGGGGSVTRGVSGSLKDLGVWLSIPPQPDPEQAPATNHRTAHAGPLTLRSATCKQ